MNWPGCLIAEAGLHADCSSMPKYLGSMLALQQVNSTTPQHCQCYAEGQYQSLQKLLETFSSYSAQAPNRHLRPACRPDNPSNARMWWQYAGAVARRQIRSQGFNWRQFERVSQALARHRADVAHPHLMELQHPCTGPQ